MVADYDTSRTAYVAQSVAPSPVLSNLLGTWNLSLHAYYGWNHRAFIYTNPLNPYVDILYLSSLSAQIKLVLTVTSPINISGIWGVSCSHCLIYSFFEKRTY